MVTAVVLVAVLVLLAAAWVWLGRHPGRRVSYAAVRDAHRDALAFDKQVGANVDLSWTAASRNAHKPS